MSELPDSSRCRFCVDGMMPTGSPLIGPAYRECPVCIPTCPGCAGTGRFTVNRITRRDLIAIHHEQGLQVVFCDTCGGIVAIHRLHGQVNR